MSKIDFSVIDTKSINYSEITNQVKKLRPINKDATKLNTSNTNSFIASFKDLFNVEIPVIEEPNE